MTEQLANTILNKIFELSTKIDTVATVVKRHDESTFPQMQEELKSQSKALFRMESKQNKDILQFIEEKEKIHTRLVPLEDHVKSHKIDNSKSETIEVEKIKSNTEIWKLVFTSVVSIVTAVLASVGIKLTLSQ